MGATSPDGTIRSKSKHQLLRRGMRNSDSRRMESASGREPEAFFSTAVQKEVWSGPFGIRHFWAHRRESIRDPGSAERVQQHLAPLGWKGTAARRLHSRSM